MSRKTIVFDANRFSDLASFYQEVENTCTKDLGWSIGRNLNAFNDVLRGGFGSDQIFGGPDNDEIYGGGDNDFVHGQEGSDQVWGNDGNDFVYGEDGLDHLWGGIGNDHLYVLTTTHVDAGTCPGLRYISRCTLRYFSPSGSVE